MSDLASLFSYSSQELEDDVSVRRNKPNHSGAVEGRSAKVSSRSAVVNFKRPGGIDGLGQDGEPVSFDPVAHPAHPTCAEGTAHPISKFSAEPLREKPVERSVPALSRKTELDIRALVDAVEAAFPKPRDPQMARVLRARPTRAARPFLYVAEEQGPGSEPPAMRQAAAQGEVDGDPERIAERSRAEITRNLDVLLYDPILEGTPLEPKPKMPLNVSATEARLQDGGKAATAGVWTSGMRDRRSRRRDAAPVQAHERPLIEAVIEPKDPIAKPRLLPVLDETVPGIPARLSPFQRAQLQRPKTVRDCHGRMTVVEYRIPLADPK